MIRTREDEGETRGWGRAGERLRLTLPFGSVLAQFTNLVMIQSAMEPTGNTESSFLH